MVGHLAAKQKDRRRCGMEEEWKEVEMFGWLEKPPVNMGIGQPRTTCFAL